MTKSLREKTIDEAYDEFKVSISKGNYFRLDLLIYQKGYEQGKKDRSDGIIRYINQQKVNYGNKNIFNNQIKFIKALK